MKVTKHQQYWLRQFDWVYSQINKGDQSASSREDEDLLILVESHLDKHKDFAAKYAANTADFQKFRADLQIIICILQRPPDGGNGEATTDLVALGNVSGFAWTADPSTTNLKPL